MLCPACARGSLLLQAHVLVGRSEVELRVQADGGLLDPRADSVQGGGVEDGAEHDAVVHQALDPMQHRLTLLASRSCACCWKRSSMSGYPPEAYGAPVMTKVSRRTAVLPGAAETVTRTPPSFFDRHASM